MKFLNTKEEKKMFGRNYRWFDPWSEFETLFGGFAPTGATETCGYDYPAMNYYTKNDSAVIEAELPGVEAGDIDIAVEGTMLKLTGERKSHAPEKDEHLRRSERWSGRFERSVELPFTVENEKVEATFHNGVLTITLPRAEAEKPRKISISAN
jgi:HSP20 family protein